MTKITNWITEKMISNNTICDDEREVYVYCINCVLETVFMWITMLFIGIVTKRIYEALLFNVYFFIIRSKAGGFHAKTFARCYFLSVATYSLVLYLSICLCESNGILQYSAASVVVLLLAPVDSANKPIEKSREILRNVKFKIATISIIFGIIYALLYLHKIRCCQVIVISSYMVMISQICGIFSNRIQKRETLTNEEKQQEAFCSESICQDVLTSWTERR